MKFRSAKVRQACQTLACENRNAARGRQVRIHGTAKNVQVVFKNGSRRREKADSGAKKTSEFLLPLTDFEEKADSRIGYPPLDAFEQVHVKRLADIVTCQVLDRRLNHDPVRATMPRGVGTEAPSPLLDARSGLAFHNFAKIVQNLK